MESRGVDPVSPAVLLAFCAGQELALAAIYARWSPLVYSVALRALASVTAAELVAGRVFAAAWDARRTFDPDRQPMSTWLLELTKQEISRRRDPVDVAQVADQALLLDGLARLDPGPRRVLRLALFENLSHAEISERLHLPERVVVKDIRGGLMALRKRLEVTTDACRP